MPLVFILGGLGSGKTLYLTKQLIWYKSKGYNIYANYNLKHINYTLLEHPLEILEISTTKNVIGGDEFYHWFDSYENNKEKMRIMRNIINVTRKKDLIILATTQTIGQINLRYRLINDLFLFPYYFKDKDVLKVIVKTQPTGVESYGVLLEYLYTQYIYNMKRYFKYYDTNEILEEFYHFDGVFEDKEQTTLF